LSISRTCPELSQELSHSDKRPCRGRGACRPLPYASTTLLVNGFDVTGHPRPPGGQTACRADLPTEEQILAALRGLSVLSRGSALKEQLQAIVFQSLLETAKPVSLDYLVAAADLSAVEILSAMGELRWAGHVRLDFGGCIIGAVGLRVTLTLHVLPIDCRTFCTSCAFERVWYFWGLACLWVCSVT
jgi:hypothetical protein